MHSIATFFVGLWMGLLSLVGISAQSSAPPQPQLLQAVQQAAEHTQTNEQQSGTSTAAGSATGAGTTVPVSVGVPSKLPATGSTWQSSLPLGDGKYMTSAPKQGYIYVCHVAQGGQGAQGNPVWIHGTTWSPAEKVAVMGSVSWPTASYSMRITGTMRTIVANGLPTDHTTGIFPIQQSDPAHQYDGNPNSIAVQSYSYSLPVSPTMLAQPNCIYGQVGIMQDGIPLFDGFDAEYRDAVAHETQDDFEGHPDQSSEYHYHGFEDGFVKDPVSTVVGFAFDGYPITGGKLPDGSYLTTSDLDVCHGITSAIALDGKTFTMYHYVLTQDFPYSVACFRGKSYEPTPGQGGSQPAQMQGQRPPPPPR